MVHGGAGALEKLDNDKEAVRHLESIRCVLEHGRMILRAGGSALEAVEQCASLLEDDPIFNAGAGSVLNEDGKVEMDAAIMCGASLAAGAVAGISDIANPIQLARVVLAESEHLLLIGAGARRFADRWHFERMPESYFRTRERVAQWEQLRSSGGAGLDHDVSVWPGRSSDDKHGTIGVVARDGQGNLAAATSTGGIVNKQYGRVGDSPIIGAGVYADNATCAVSCTGVGEDFMRTVLAKTLADLIEFKELDGAAAAVLGIEYLQRKVAGRGGFILIDRQGGCAAGCSTRRMIHGWIEKGGETHCKF
ncbi:MAG: isoaspartyl peptidase/L-asparaginase [Gammaproteobacteria bacterium]|nr:isoaspartyl peptidase/L-asparaginase [Gammaproteobacteria bacterium]MCP5416661.1 isoaspartyl peptidase/L-asparaginase [Chromatiaceae bacterium]